MAVALVYPDPQQAGLRRGEKVSGIPGIPETSRDSLMKARAVLKEFGADSDIVQQIKMGGS